MNKELQDKLYEKYPKLFRQKDLSMQETCMCWGIETGDGWYDLLDNLCHSIQSAIQQPLDMILHYSNAMNSEDTNVDREFYLKRLEEERKRIIPQVEFSQVKEKFGTLRVYHNSDNPYIDGMVVMAEMMSSCICENCGNKGKMNDRGWISTLCDPCREQRYSDNK